MKESLCNLCVFFLILCLHGGVCSLGVVGNEQNQGRE
jgi:hypothetical protein